MIYALTLGNPDLTTDPSAALIATFVMIVIVHTFADFFLQTDSIATQKSSSNKILTIHIMWYMLPFLIVFGPTYTLINGVLHWIVDYCTSRIAKSYFLKDQRHNFFCTVGVDQALHLICLVATLPVILQ